MFQAAPPPANEMVVAAPVEGVSGIDRAVTIVRGPDAWPPAGGMFLNYVSITGAHDGTEEKYYRVYSGDAYQIPPHRAVCDIQYTWFRYPNSPPGTAEPLTKNIDNFRCVLDSTTF